MVSSFSFVRKNEERCLSLLSFSIIFPFIFLLSLSTSLVSNVSKALILINGRKFCVFLLVVEINFTRSTLFSSIDRYSWSRFIRHVRSIDGHWITFPQIINESRARFLVLNLNDADNSILWTEFSEKFWTKRWYISLLTNRLSFASFHSHCETISTMKNFT